MTPPRWEKDPRPADKGLTQGGEGVATGPFRIEMLLSSQTDGEMTALRAVFGPGVISHWHSHPRGQFLFGLEGVGLAQCEGGDVFELRPGDSVWFAPNERHWHGAAATCSFAYLSIQPVEDGKTAHWFEPVSPAQGSG